MSRADASDAFNGEMTLCPVFCSISSLLNGEFGILNLVNPLSGHMRHPEFEWFCLR